MPPGVNGIARVKWIVIAVLVLAGCGSNAVTPTPSSPSSFVASTPSQTWTVSGSVINVVDGAPIPFARLALSQQAATANEAGAFSLNGSGSFVPQSIVVQSDTSLTRETVVAAAGTRTIDVVSTLAPFSDVLYRELAFNGLENPAMRSTCHWTVQPRFHIRTVFDDTRDPVPPAYVDFVSAEIQRVTPQWTGYAFDGIVTAGPDLPPDTVNRVTVLFVHPDAAQAHCGSSTVSCAIVGNPSTIWFNVTPGSTSTCFASSAHIAHEVGHALGFWHISGGGIMRSGTDKGVLLSCRDTIDLTPNERFHARLMYSRPTGTMYPDKSPTSFSLRSVTGQGGTLVVD
jgi:hypothetical protein